LKEKLDFLQAKMPEKRQKYRFLSPASDKIPAWIKKSL